MKRDCVIGIDLGTTSVKVVATDESGKIIRQTTQFYEPMYGKNGEVEQDPEIWWNSTVIAIRQISSSLPDYVICAVGLTGQMHGSVVLDDRGRSIRPALLWNDQRAEEQAKRMRQELGQETINRLTGNQVVTGFTAPKLMWLKDEEPDVFKRIEHVLLPKDYIRYKLTLSLDTDVNDASGTLLFDVSHRKWSSHMMEYVGLKSSSLPSVLECLDSSGTILPNIANDLGLSERTIVIAGAGDQAAAAVGMCILDEGQCNISLGTSGVIFTPVNAFHEENQGQLHQFCFVTKGTWSLMGVMLSAAASIKWWNDLTNQIEGTEDRTIPKHTPLLFLPYLSGERTPHLDMLARGAFIGLHRTHSLPHLSRAILEGVSFALRDSYEILLKVHIQLDQFRVTGGGANNTEWMNILSNVFRSLMNRVDHVEGAAYGAAVLAALSIGMIPNMEAYKQIWKHHKLTTFEPNQAEEDYYMDLYEIFKDGYRSLQDLNRRLQHISR